MSKETVAITKLRKVVSAIPSEEDVFFEAGGSTFHLHRCPEGHQWKCNSPYCNSLLDLCPDHGGPEPTAIGREPWKR